MGLRLSVPELASLLRDRLAERPDGVRVTEVLTMTGVPRATYYRVPAGPRPPAKRPGPAPKQLSDDQVEAIIRTAVEHRRLGYKKVHEVMARDKFEGIQPVSRRDVYRVMREHRLLKPKKAASKAKEIARLRLAELQPKRPNRLWQMDVTYVRIPRYGWYFVVTVMDYFSRFLLAQHFTHSYRAAEGVRAIEKAIAQAEELTGPLREPVLLLTDNGTTFTARTFAHGLKRHLIEETANEKLRHIRIGYRMPEHLGLLERFHGSLKAEEVWPNWYSDPVEAMKSIEEYGRYYNFERPHWSLHLKTPAQVYLGQSWDEVKARFLVEDRRAA